VVIVSFIGRAGVVQRGAWEFFEDLVGVLTRREAEVHLRHLLYGESAEARHEGFALLPAVPSDEAFARGEGGI
jgi:hypothetical protein